MVRGQGSLLLETALHVTLEQLAGATGSLPVPHHSFLPTSQPPLYWKQLAEVYGESFITSWGHRMWTSFCSLVWSLFQVIQVSTPGFCRCAELFPSTCSPSTSCLPRCVSPLIRNISSPLLLALPPRCIFHSSECLNSIIAFVFHRPYFCCGPGGCVASPPEPVAPECGPAVGSLLSVFGPATALCLEQIINPRVQHAHLLPHLLLTSHHLGG